MLYNFEYNNFYGYRNNELKTSFIAYLAKEK